MQPLPSGGESPSSRKRQSGPERQLFFLGHTLNDIDDSRLHQLRNILMDCFCKEMKVAGPTPAEQEALGPDFSELRKWGVLHGTMTIAWKGLDRIGLGKRATDADIDLLKHESPAGLSAFCDWFGKKIVTIHQKTECGAGVPDGRFSGSFKAHKHKKTLGVHTVTMHCTLTPQQLIALCDSYLTGFSSRDADIRMLRSWVDENNTFKPDIVAHFNKTYAQAVSNHASGVWEAWRQRLTATPDAIPMVFSLDCRLGAPFPVIHPTVSRFRWGRPDEVEKTEVIYGASHPMTEAVNKFFYLTASSHHDPGKLGASLVDFFIAYHMALQECDPAFARQLFHTMAVLHIPTDREFYNRSSIEAFWNPLSPKDLVAAREAFMARYRDRYMLSAESGFTDLGQLFDSVLEHFKAISDDCAYARLTEAERRYLECARRRECDRDVVKSVVAPVWEVMVPPLLGIHGRFHVSDYGNKKEQFMQNAEDKLVRRLSNNMEYAQRISNAFRNMDSPRQA